MRRGRPSTRLRLTWWYGGLVLATGALLLVLNFLLVRHSLTVDPAELRGAISRRIDRDIVEVPVGTAPSFRGVVPGDDRSYVVSVGGAQRGLVEEALDRLVVQSGIALAVMSVASLGVGWVMAGRALRPVEEITAAARRLSQDTLHERIGLQRPDDELKRLADTFDEMLGRLDVAFAAQREFVANASHELRTPLAIIRTELDVTLADPDASVADLRAMAAAIRTATGRSEALIEALLTLARADGRIAHSSVDVDALLSAAIDDSAARAAAERITVRRSLDGAEVVGDAALLERLVGNLVDNAVRHNRSGGWVLVSSRGDEDAVAVTVSNSGPVIPPDEVDRLFERFRRLDRSRSRATGGFGLGLSIVAAVADAHGGAVRARAPESGGLVVDVVLPRVPVAARPDAGRGPAEERDDAVDAWLAARHADGRHTMQWS